MDTGIALRPPAALTGARPAIPLSWRLAVGVVSGWRVRLALRLVVVALAWSTVSGGLAAQGTVSRVGDRRTKETRTMSERDSQNTGAQSGWRYRGWWWPILAAVVGVAVIGGTGTLVA